MYLSFIKYLIIKVSYIVKEKLLMTTCSLAKYENLNSTINYFDTYNKIFKNILIQQSIRLKY